MAANPQEEGRRFHLPWKREEGSVAKEPPAVPSRSGRGLAAVAISGLDSGHETLIDDENGTGLAVYANSRPKRRVEKSTEGVEKVLPPDNQDAYIADPQRGLLAVFDGLSRPANGAMASAAARDSVGRNISSRQPISVEHAKQQIRDALVIASHDVRNDADGGLTTAVVARILTLAGRDQLVYGSVGDSRLHLVREGKITQLTKDDNGFSREAEDEVANAKSESDLGREARVLFLHRNVIDKTIGSGQELNVDVESIELEPEDIIVLTTDGVHDNVTRDEILARVSKMTYNPAIQLEIAASKRAAIKGGYRMKGSPPVSDEETAVAQFRGKEDDMTSVVVLVNRSGLHVFGMEDAVHLADVADGQVVAEPVAEVPVAVDPWDKLNEEIVALKSVVTESGEKWEVKDIQWVIRFVRSKWEEADDQERRKLIAFVPKEEGLRRKVWGILQADEVQ